MFRPSKSCRVDLMKTYICEFLGTFFLVFAGTGSIIANDSLGGTIGHVSIALSFGLVVMAVIYAIGDTSGAHINPAVTIGFFLIRRLNGYDMVLYILFQCAGAIVASYMLAVIFPVHELLGGTFPHISLFGAFLYEFLLTFFLMFVILSVATGSKEKGLMAGLAIGGTVALEALFAGPVTGASMNPARSLGPAFISGQWDVMWLYFLAPILGAASAIPACKYLHINCCNA